MSHTKSIHWPRCACGCGAIVDPRCRYVAGHRPPPSADDDARRFWAKVDRSGDCWLWLGSRDSRGYGRFGVRGRAPQLAHRVAWMLVNGPIPDELFVLHDCPTRDNPRCVNPTHLRLGTRADNAADAVRKGQLPSGDRQWTRRDPDAITWRRYAREQVIEARRLRASGVGRSEIAARLGINLSTLAKMLRGDTWTHV